MNKFHFGTMAEIQKNFKCCDDPCFEEGDRSYPPDDDFIIEYNCTNCGKRTLDHYKLVCMEEVVKTDDNLKTLKEMDDEKYIPESFIGTEKGSV